MLASHARPQIARVLEPLGRRLASTGLSPDVITVVGTLGVTAGALAFYPFGRLFWGTIVITLFVFSDMLDGLLARAQGVSSPWGAFLDSSSDRVGDAAIFGGLVLWFSGGGHSQTMVAVTLYCLAAGATISYVKARAEGLGFTCNVGIAERGERLVIVLAAAGLSGLGVPYLLPVALWVLAVLTTITVIQRLVHVRRQALGAASRSARPAPLQRRRTARQGDATAGVR